MNYLASFRGGPLDGELRQLATSEPSIPVFGQLSPEAPTPDSPSKFVRLITHRYRRFCHVHSGEALDIMLYEYVGIDSH